MIDLDNFSMRRDIEALLSDIEKSRRGLGSMVIDIHWAAAEEIMTRLRQAEKDAARYKNEVEAAKFDIGNLSSKLERADSVIFEVEMVLSERQKNGFFECDDLLSEAQYYINNHQGIKE